MPNVTSTSTPASTPEGAQAAATSSTPAPTDFVLALTQMLGGTPVAATAAQLAQPSLANESKHTLAELEEEIAAALASLPLPGAPIQVQVPAPASGNADPLELLGLNPRAAGPSARDAALLQALTERLNSIESPATVDVDATPTALAALDAQATRATSPTAVPQTRALHTPVGTSAWADELSSRVTVMTQKGEHTASLRLSPEHLGPLEVRIAMRDEQASVWFGAAHADTRAAIEQALPRLREMFEAQGMSLTDAGVFREPPRQQASTFDASTPNAESDATNDASSGAAKVSVGLLDAYA